MHSRGTPGYTQSRNAGVYTVEERQGIHSSGMHGFTQSRNAWVYIVAERVGLHCLGTRGFTDEERLDLRSRETPG